MNITLVRLILPKEKGTSKMGNLHVSQGDTDLVVPCDAPVMPLPHLVEVDAQFGL